MIWEDNTKMDPGKKNGFEDGRCVKLDQDCVEWRVLMVPQCSLLFVYFTINCARK